MKQTVSEHDFVQAFDDYNRSENFSIEGRRALYDFLEEVMGEDWELDVIGICCDFSEHESAAVCAAEYDGHIPDPAIEDEDETNEAALEWLRARTTVIEFDGGVIVGAF